jgi:site-specific recombinase XerD
MSRPVSNPFASHILPSAQLALNQTNCRYTRTQLVGFVGFLGREEVSLAAARQEHLLAYSAECEAMAISRPKQVVRDTAHAWNRMIGKPGWPKTQLVPPSSTRSSIRYQDLPPGLRADADSYFNSRDGSDEDDLFNPAAPQPLATATLKDRKGKLCQLVAHYVEAGGRLQDLETLNELVTEAALKKILGHIWTKTNKSRNAHAANLARFLRLIAKYHCNAPESILQLIRNAEDKFKPETSGMTAKNKKRLRTILEDTALPRLLTLPADSIVMLDPAHPTLADAIKVQSALAMQIELEAPMRAKNLAALDINQHFDFVSDTQAHIIVESDDVKNKVTLNYVLGGRFMKLYRLYVNHYRPLLVGEHQTSALFISRTGRTKNPAELAAKLQSFIKDGTGLRMNVHLFRHLTGYIFLRHFPGQYEPVRQLLGHKSIKTTIAFYVGLEEDATFKRYGAILDELIAKEGSNESI